MEHQQKKTFPGISARAWEHPADRAGLSVLRAIPGFDQVLKFLGSQTSDRTFRLMFLGSAIQVSGLQFPAIHRLTVQACEILDIQPVPEVFITNDPHMNAFAIGYDTPMIVLNSSLVQSLSEPELMAVIGHELAHIKAGHMVYRTMLWVLVNLSFHFFQLDDLIRIPLIYALKDWDRKAELSCDRAGLLVVQNPDDAYRLMMKLASGGLENQTDLDSLIKQAEEYESSGDVFDSLIKLGLTLNSTHPLGMERIKSLKTWVDQGHYQKILDGEFVGGEKNDDPLHTFQDAWKNWEQEINQSKDPGTRLAADVVKGFQKAATDVVSFFENLTKGKPKDE